MKKREMVSWCLPSVLVGAVSLLMGCYFFDAHREVQDNEKKVRDTNAEIQKEIDRKKHLEETVK